MKTSQFGPVRPLDSAAAAIRTGLHNLAIRGSGCDEDLLRQHGSAQCRGKAASAGYANLAASTLGGLGAFGKTFSVVSGLLAFPVALVIAVLYWGLVFNLERSLASTIDAFWPVKTKLKALAVRTTIALITAAFQAGPWILIALDSEIGGRLQKFELKAREEARAALEKLHNIRAINDRAAILTKTASDAAGQVWVLPEVVIDARQLAERCDKDAEGLFQTNKKKAANLQARLPALANIELSQIATAGQKAAAQRERNEIAKRVNRLADEVAEKRNVCKTAHSQATDAQNRYLTDATAKSERAKADVEGQRRVAAEAGKALDADIAEINVVVKKSNSVKSGAQVKAAIALVQEEVSSALTALAIYLWFFIVDLACTGFKLMGKPGPYDHELRKRDKLKQIECERVVLTAEKEDEAASAESDAKLRGAKKFLEAEGVDFFCNLERHRHVELSRQAVGAADIRVGAAQPAEIQALGQAVDDAFRQVQSNPTLIARLSALLDVLRNRAPTASAA